MGDGRFLWVNFSLANPSESSGLEVPALAASSERRRHLTHAYQLAVGPRFDNLLEEDT